MKKMGTSDRLKYQQLMEQDSKPDTDPLKVGFYDSATDSMVAVEQWPDSIHMARFSSAQMATTYQTGRHRMPSPVWCVWNKNEHASIFLLDEKPRDVAFLNHVLTLLV
jgi:hypothetical protein